MQHMHRRGMLQYLAVGTVLIAIGWMGAHIGSARAARPLPEAYTHALTALQQEEWYEAVLLLEEAVLVLPPRTVQQQRQPATYFPYLYMAYAYAHLGQLDAARAFYRLAQRLGGYMEHPETRKIAVWLEKTLYGETGPLVPPSEPPPPEPSESASKEAPADTCTVRPAPDPYQLPWYFHYALGTELIEREQYREALRSLQRAVMLNPEPAPKKRTYGMWHIVYRPYYYITLAFYRMGRYDCARQYAEKSIRYREIPPGHADYPAWHRLLSQLGMTQP